jgi:hypothetical protein
MFIKNTDCDLCHSGIKIINIKKKRKNPEVPSFNKISAKITDPAVGAST